jgi:ATP-dependent RNA circularization protein (DNA/RNA ligase family)
MKEEKNDGKRTVLNVNINVEAIANAARNVDHIDNLALEINTVNPRKITLEQEIYTLKSVPWNDKLKGKKKDEAPRVVGIRSMVVDSLSTTAKQDHITINGILDVPKNGHKVVKLEECLFETEDDARAVAQVLTTIELEKVTAIRDEADEAIIAITKQIEDDRF